MTLTTTIGGALSDSYATLAEYTARAAAMGWTLAADPANEVNLRKAALSIDISNSFSGLTVSPDQARQWPRVIVDSVGGWPVSSLTIPQAIKDAQMEMAYLIQGGATPLETDEGAVASTRAKAGPVEVETSYIGGKRRASYPSVSRLLAPYLSSGAGQINLVRG